MKKMLVLLLSAMLLVGCGNSSQSETVLNQSTVVTEESQAETQEKKEEAKNLYESEELVTKTVGDIEYQVPESWEKSVKSDDTSVYYYDDDMMIMVQIQEVDFKTFDGTIAEESEEEVKQAFWSGIESGFIGCEKVSDKSQKIVGVTGFRYKANNVKLDELYYMDLLAFAYNYKLYSFGLFVEANSELNYSEEFESLLGTIALNKEFDSSANDPLNQLKELYKKEASNKLSYSEEDSKSYFELVLKTSKELVNTGKGKSAEELGADQIFGAFMLSAGYLCNYYEGDTEYGEVGNLAFDLIGYIVKNDEENCNRIIEKFENIALDHGWEIITSDQANTKTSENEQMESEEPIELSTGKYIVGEDIPAGKYDIIGIESGNVRVCSQGKDYGDIVSEIIEEGKTVYANVTLENDYTVEIVNGGKIQLQSK